MRGAYYVATALLVFADSSLPDKLQTHDHDVMKAANNVDVTLAKRYLRESRDVHDDLAPIAAAEERMDNFDLISIEGAFGPSWKAALLNVEESVKTLKTALMKAWYDLHLRTSGDTAVIADACHNPLSGEPTPELTSWWDNEINMHPEITVAGHPNTPHPQEYTALTREMKEQNIPNVRHKFNRALATGRAIGPFATGHLLNYDPLKLKATHDAFFEIAGKSHNPTMDEIKVLLYMMDRTDCTEDATRPSFRKRIRELATRDVVRGMKKLLEDDEMWIKWVAVTYFQRVAILDHSLDKHVRRWTEMFILFFQTKPHISKPDPKTLKSLPSLGKSTQPSLDSNIGKSRDQAPFVRGKLQNPHVIKPTPTSLTTKDFLSNLGKRSHSSLDDNIGTSRDQAPSMPKKA